MCGSDLAAIRDSVLKSCLASVRQFEYRFENTIIAYDFKPGDLVLMHNPGSDLALGLKTKPCDFSRMVVLKRTCNGAVSKLHYTVFCLDRVFCLLTNDYSSHPHP